MTIVAIFTKFLVTAIEFFSTVILSLSLFRIPFRYYLAKLSLTACLMAAISIYTRDILNNITYSLLPVWGTEIILIMIIFRIPIFYSALICIIGVLLAITFETIVATAGTLIGITSPSMIENSIYHFVIMDLIVSILMFLISYIIQKKRIGFLFIVRYLRLNMALKGYNFILSIILISGLTFSQFMTMVVQKNNFYIYIPIAYTILFVIGVLVAYMYNKKLLKDKYERLNKK